MTESYRRKPKHRKRHGEQYNAEIRQPPDMKDVEAYWRKHGYSVEGEITEDPSAQGKKPYMQDLPSPETWNEQYGIEGEHPEGKQVTFDRSAVLFYLDSRP